MNKTIHKYLERNPPKRTVESLERLRGYRNVVVIPVLDECGSFEQTLESLSQNPKAELDQTLVLTVINNHTACSPEKVRNNQKLLEDIRKGRIRYNHLHLAWIDASSPGLEVSKSGGVGDARKIGLDSSLSLVEWQREPLFFCLDADTLVEKNYLEAVRQHYHNFPNHVGAVVEFQHRLDDNATREAIIDYELFMRLFQLGLHWAGFPYDYHAIGSAMTFRPHDYVRAGGMRCKNGGEDFYFLQDLRKTGPIGAVSETIIYPSSRPSIRVDFGTGPRLISILAGENLKGYNFQVFCTIKTLCATVESLSIGEFSNLPDRLKKSLNLLESSYFEQVGFPAQWRKIFRNTKPTEEKMRWAFFTWFDAFRALKFIHFLETCEGYRRVSFAGAYAPLLDAMGCNPSKGVFESNYALLEWVRSHQPVMGTTNQHE